MRVPDGWSKLALGEVLQLEYGKPLPDADRSANGKYPVYGANGEKDRTNKSYWNKPSVIVGRKGSAGEVNLTEPRFWPLDVTYFVTFDDKRYDLRFLYNLLLLQDLPALAKGVKPGINRNEVYDLPVCVPPLAEQRRIVAILDEAFAAIATAKANTEKNLHNARAVFESERETVISSEQPGWMMTSIGEDVDLLSGFPFKSGGYTDNPKDVRLLRGDNIIQGRLRWDDAVRWPAKDTAEYARYALAQGDVVLAMDRPWVKAGLKYAQVGSDDLPALLVQRTSRLRSGARLDQNYLKHLLGSSAFSRHLLGVQTGIGVPHISGQQIKDFKFARPSLAEQQRLASRLDRCAVEVQHLESLAQQKLAALDALKASLLHHAFTGQLTARTAAATLATA